MGKKVPKPATHASTLVLGTRGLKARHRHLMRDLLRLLPHGLAGSKHDTCDNSLAGVASACEDADCSAALLLDARDSERLFMWVVSCPDGPSAMFRVRNVHTVAELNFDTHRCAGVRNLLSFDASFDTSAHRRVLKALLVRTLSVPRGAAEKRSVAAMRSTDTVAAPSLPPDDEALEDAEKAVTDAASAAAHANRPRAAQQRRSAAVERVKHVLAFSWVDERIWLRVYRVGPDALGLIDVAEIGPRLVLEPVRIIAAAFSGAILHAHQGSGSDLAGEREMR